jgi:hypothetical protein
MRKQIEFLRASRRLDLVILSVDVHARYMLRKGESTRWSVTFFCFAVSFGLGCSNTASVDVSNTQTTPKSKMAETRSQGSFAPGALGMSAEILTSRDQFDANLGKLVALHGVVSNTKRATILGVEISPEHLRGHDAYAVGILAKWNESVEPNDVGVQSARSSVATYVLYFDLSGTLAKAREWPSSEIRPK